MRLSGKRPSDRLPLGKSTLFQPGMITRKTSFAIPLWLAAIALSACSSRQAEDEQAARARVEEMRPPPVAEGDPALRVTLSGGPFGDGETIAFPMTAGFASWRRTGGGLRFSVEPPGFSESRDAPLWGIWLLLDGPIREGATLRFRTGSQIVVDGIPYAPAAVPNAPPSRNNHQLEGGLEIAYLIVQERFLEGRLRSKLLPPAGDDPIQLNATLEIHLDRPPAP